MSHAEFTRKMNVPAKRVWDAINDHGGVHKFHPYVETSPLLSANNSGLGAKRRCEFYDKTSVVEEVIGWEDGTSLTVVLSEGSMPFSRAEATLRVVPAAENTSHASIEMDYDVKYGPIGWLMNKLIIRRKMEGLFATVLEGLEHHGKTGELIGQNGVSLGKPETAKLAATS